MLMQNHLQVCLREWRDRWLSTQVHWLLFQHPCGNLILSTQLTNVYNSISRGPNTFL